MLSTLFLLHILAVSVVPLFPRDVNYTLGADLSHSGKSLADFVKELVLLLQSAILIVTLYSYTLITPFFNGFPQSLYFFHPAYSFSISILSYPFILLSALLFPFCILIYWNHNKEDMKGFLLTLNIIHFILFLIFTTTNLLVFYISFEALLIPMFLLIGKWGARSAKITAAFQFFFYTILGSFFLLMGIIYIFYTKGTTDINLLYITDFSVSEQLFLFLAFFASFAVKIPLFPFHIWLPEAHVEAPTAGSVILAGILLKLGVYGFLRFSIPLFPIAVSYFYPLIETLAIIGIIYSSLSTLRQIDLKKVLAYASIAHMNLVVLGLFSQNLIAVAGAIFLLFAHGLVSPALFISIGFLYDRHGSRIIQYYSGLAHLLPLFSVLFFGFTLANFSFPFTASFVAEFLIFVGLWNTSPLATLFASSSIILSLLYSLWLLNRILFGPIGGNSLLHNFTFKSNDLVYREFHILFPLLVLILIFGLTPNFFLDFINLPVSFLVPNVL